MGDISSVTNSSKENMKKNWVFILQKKVSSLRMISDLKEGAALNLDQVTLSIKPHMQERFNEMEEIIL